MVQAASDELVKSGVRAAREARKELAKVIHEMDDDTRELGLRLSEVVGTLFSAEVGGADRVHGSLGDARERLRRLLEPDGGPADGDDVARSVSRALALIHPAYAELGKALGGEREDATAPFLLQPSRVKPSGPPPGAEERRGTGRAVLEAEVGLEGANRFYTGKTGDLSQGGLFIATDTPLLVGTELVLSFVLPDGYRVSAEATVAWVRAPRYRPHELPAGMGVRFDALSAEDHRAIEHFLDQRPPFHYGD